jgi:hypothetical protein
MPVIAAACPNSKAGGKAAFQKENRMGKKHLCAFLLANYTLMNFAATYFVYFLKTGSGRIAFNGWLADLPFPMQLYIWTPAVAGLVMLLPGLLQYIHKLYAKFKKTIDS